MRLLILLLLILSAVSAEAQPDQNKSLALQYYRSGEFEKAIDLFQDLYKQNKSSSYYFQYLYRCHINLQDFEGAEKLCQKAAKKNPNETSFLIYLGQTYDLMVEPEKAENQYQKALASVPNNPSGISKLANAFIAADKLRYALDVYDLGAKKLGRDPYLMQKANLYEKLGETEAYIECYLDKLEEDPEFLPTIQNQLQAFIDEEVEYETLQVKLYKRIQQINSSPIFTELLIWQFIQRKDFESALIQVIALDRRLEEEGRRVMKLASSAVQEKKYVSAIEAYDYIVEQGPEHPRYFSALQKKLNTRAKKIYGSYPILQTDLSLLEKELGTFIKDYDKKDEVLAHSIRDMAKLQARYFNKAKEAAEILEPVTQWQGIGKKLKGEMKLDLGDYQLIAGDIWEATLTYSQVDKAWKDHPLGEEARFRNAKWSYYQGDFDWAQTQLDVLKGSTSELIANDALKLSVFITDNTGLDTTMESMELFAKAELAAFQNQLDRALKLHAENLDRFSGSMLADDIVFAQADIYFKKGEVDRAAQLLEELETNYAWDLLADDALFRLACLYQDHMGEPEKALECFQKLILNYKDSLYIVESRRRFRQLRGDLVE